MSTNDDIRDAFIRHQIFVQRYAKGREREAEEFINKVLEEAVGRLNVDLTTLSRARLDRLIQDLLQLIDELNGDYTEGFIQEALDFVEYEVGFNFRLLGANVSVSTILPNMAQVQAAMLTNIMNLEPTKGYTIRDALKEFGRKKGQQIVQKIREGVVLGDTTQTIVKNIKDLEGIQGRQAAALARTVTNHISIQARQITMRENDDIIDSYQWVATLDSRTSLICASRDGQIFKDIDSNPKPPAHFNCRSTITYVVKPEFDLGADIVGERPSKGADGTKVISADTTYEQWLRKQPPSFQTEVLGATKAKLFRDGKVSIGRFVDDQGRVLSLDQLRELEPLAFERAGL